MENFIRDTERQTGKIGLNGTTRKYDTDANEE